MVKLIIMFFNNKLNQRSQTIVSTIYEQMKHLPQFAHYTIGVNSSNLLTTGCISIDISNNGHSVNMFLFCPKGNGDIGSIAIYGSNLKKHYNTILSSKNIFGFKVTDISMDGGFTDFIDVYIAPY